MIPSKPRALLLLLTLAASLPAQALQTVTARDGETVFAKISQKELTRIAFERGRIRKVTGNAGEFVLEKDEDKGQIFLRPASPEITKPINLFLTSDRSTVALLLQPVDAPSDSLVIREARDPTTVPTPVERSHRHVRTVKNLLLAMATDAMPDDMEVRETHQELALWAGLRLTLVRSHLGADLVGEKYLLANVTHGDLQLSPRDLYKPGVIAVSLEGEQIRAGEAVALFVIRERRPHE
jgi:conjugal transfer pilus assembly protein TraK